MRVVGTRMTGAIRVLVLAGVCGLGGLVIGGCGEASAQTGAAQATSSGLEPSAALFGHIGKRVKLHLKRDALGVANASGIGPLVDTANGSDLSISGKLLGIDADWVHIERQWRMPATRDTDGMVRDPAVVSGGEIFVPRDVVLVIAVTGE